MTEAKQVNCPHCHGTYEHMHRCFLDPKYDKTWINSLPRAHQIVAEFCAMWGEREVEREGWWDDYQGSYSETISDWAGYNLHCLVDDGNWRDEDLHWELKQCDHPATLARTSPEFIAAAKVMLNSLLEIPASDRRWEDEQPDSSGCYMSNYGPNRS